MAKDSDVGVAKLPLFYFWAGIGAVSSYLLRLLFARTMTPDQYGAFYAVIGLISFAVIFNDFGLSHGLAYHLAKWAKDERRRKSVFTFVLSVKLLLGLLLGGLLAVFHRQIAVYYLHTPSLSHPLLLFSAYFLFEGLTGVVSAYFLGTKRTALYASMGQARVLVTLLLSGAAYLLFPTANLLTVYFLAWFAGVVLTAVAYASRVPFAQLLSIRLDGDVRRPIMRYSGLLFLAGVSGVLLSNLDVATITYFRSTLEVGFYQIALPVATLFFVLIDPLNAFLSSLFLHRHHEQKDGSLPNAFRMIYGTGTFLLLPFALFIALFAKEVILVMFGAEYLAAAPALTVLAAAFFCKGFYSINSIFLYSTGRPKATMVITTIGVALNLVMNILLVPRYGFVAAAWTTLVSFFLMMLLMLVAVRQTAKFPLPWVAWMKTTAISVLLIAGTMFLKGVLSLGIYVKATVIAAFFLVAYLGLGVLLRVVDWKALFAAARLLLAGMRSWFPLGNKFK